MNLMLLCDEYPPGRHGGIGAAVQLLARTLVQQGHRVVVAGFYDWGYGGEDYFVDEGVEIYRFRRRLASPLLVRRELFGVKLWYRVLRDSGVLYRDVVHGLRRFGEFLNGLIDRYGIELVEMPDFQDYSRYCKKETHFPNLKVPVVVKLHSTLTYLANEANEPIRPSVRATERAILQQADAVVSVSRYTASKTAQYLDYRRPIEIIRNGIPVNPLSSDSERQPYLVVFTGALMENKGIFQLAKAWNKVAAVIPEATLEVFGKGPVEKVVALLDHAARERVVFHGHVTRDTLTARLQRAALGVFPSFAESFALAPIEAMAAGAAVIFTSRTSGPELIHDGINGLLQDPADADGLAGKIIVLLQQPELRKRLARAGRAHVEKHLDIQVIAMQNVAFYEKVIAAGKIEQPNLRPA